MSANQKEQNPFEVDFDAFKAAVKEYIDFLKDRERWEDKDWEDQRDAGFSTLSMMYFNMTTNGQSWKKAQVQEHMASKLLRMADLYSDSTTIERTMMYIL